ncbi:MAG: lamin tail domain-containing protein [Polyangiaceae bacterium]
MDVPKGQSRVIINEVLANPYGAEPTEEWVELFNAGSATAELYGWKLADSGGQVELPALVLEPGAFVVLANEGFLGGQSGDVSPSEGSTIIRLPYLAKSGLSNAGEALRLIDESGGIRSSFPAVAASRAGVSIARESPSTLDDDAKGFLSHAAPGASPGAYNHLE